MAWTYDDCRAEAEQLGGEIVRKFSQLSGTCAALGTRWVKYKLRFGTTEPKKFWDTDSKANVNASNIPPHQSLRFPTFVQKPKNEARQYRATDAATGAGYNAVTKFGSKQKEFEGSSDRFGWAAKRIGDSLNKHAAGSFGVRQPAQEKPGLPLEKVFGVSCGKNFWKSIVGYTSTPCACLINLRGANSGSGAASSAASPIESHQVAAYYVAESGQDWIYFFDPNMGEVKLKSDQFAGWWETCHANLDAWKIYPKWTVEYYKNVSTISAAELADGWMQL